MLLFCTLQTALNALKGLTYYNHFYLLFAFTAWGITSFLVAELTRDFFHLLCHKLPPLYRFFHIYHHLSYKRDLRLVSDQIYKKGQWYHEVPESLIMLLFTLFYWNIVYGITHQ